MGRKARIREERAQELEQKINDHLRNHESQGKKTTVKLDWQHVVFATINQYEQQWVNRPSEWVNTKKTKNINSLRIYMIRFVFGVYKCPKFLENIWIPEEQRNYYSLEVKEKDNKEVDYVPWYLIVAQGGSLFKEYTKGIMSKKETHAFLHGPTNNTLVQNIWWARAFVESKNNIGIANKISQSKLIRYNLTSEFWISVMRFFVRYPTTINEIDNLVDYIVFAREYNTDYSLKGRSIEALRISCEEWHRFLNKKRKIGGGNWTGSDVKDWKYTTGKDERKTIWKITQIKTGNDLLEEGQKMRHCVVSYKYSCQRGSCSIWSLTSHDMIGNNKRCVTIELDSYSTRVVQAKGLANRSPHTTEVNVINKWCEKNHIAYATRGGW